MASGTPGMARFSTRQIPPSNHDFHMNSGFIFVPWVPALPDPVRHVLAPALYPCERLSYALHKRVFG